MNLRDDLTYKIVLVSLGDLYVVDCSYFRLQTFGNIVDENITVDLLGLAFQVCPGKAGPIPAKGLRTKPYKSVLSSI